MPVALLVASGCAGVAREFRRYPDRTFSARADLPEAVGPDAHALLVAGYEYLGHFDTSGSGSETWALKEAARRGADRVTVDDRAGEAGHTVRLYRHEPELALASALRYTLRSDLADVESVLEKGADPKQLHTIRIQDADDSVPALYFLAYQIRERPAGALRQNPGAILHAARLLLAAGADPNAVPDPERCGWGWKGGYPSLLEVVSRTLLAPPNGEARRMLTELYATLVRAGAK